MRVLGREDEARLAATLEAAYEEARESDERERLVEASDGLWRVAEEERVCSLGGRPGRGRVRTVGGDRERFTLRCEWRE